MTVVSNGISSDIEKVIVSADRISARVNELADELAAIYRGQELTVLGVLTGSLIFLADLIRRLPQDMRLRVAVAGVSSYPGAATDSQGPVFSLPPDGDFAGRHVLVLDDILDSGATLSLLMQTIAHRKPASLRCCVLLRKQRRDLHERFNADFAGFDIGDDFVVGYGLDYNNLYRNLPDICVLSGRAIRGRQ